MYSLLSINLCADISDSARFIYTNKILIPTGFKDINIMGIVWVECNRCADLKGRIIDTLNSGMALSKILGL